MKTQISRLNPSRKEWRRVTSKLLSVSSQMAKWSHETWLPPQSPSYSSSWRCRSAFWLTKIRNRLQAPTKGSRCCRTWGDKVLTTYKSHTIPRIGMKFSTGSPPSIVYLPRSVKVSLQCIKLEWWLRSRIGLMKARIVSMRVLSRSQGSLEMEI